MSWVWKIKLTKGLYKTLKSVVEDSWIVVVRCAVVAYVTFALSAKRPASAPWCTAFHTLCKIDQHVCKLPPPLLLTVIATSRFLFLAAVGQPFLRAFFKPTFDTYHNASQCYFIGVDFLPKFHCSTGDDACAQVTMATQVFRAAIAQVHIVSRMWVWVCAFGTPFMYVLENTRMSWCTY